MGLIISGDVEILDPENNEAVLVQRDAGMQEGWWFMAWVGGRWQPFKFSTVKKRSRAEKLLKILNKKYDLKFALTRGWTTIGTGDNYETEKETGSEEI